MLKYFVRISGEERKLIETIQKIGYGEVYSPKVETGPQTEILEVSANVADLLDLVRSGAPISIITIHQYEPVYAEVDQLMDGFRCRKKVKFPTV
jgi:hypothetical protein